MMKYVKRTVLSSGFTGGNSASGPFLSLPSEPFFPPGRGKREKGGSCVSNWKKQVQVSCLGKIQNLARVVVHICKLRTKEVEAGGLP